MYCKYCGENIEEGSNFCNKCGKHLDEIKTKSNCLRVISWVLIIFGILGIIGVAFFYSQFPKQISSTSINAQINDAANSLSKAADLTNNIGDLVYQNKDTLKNAGDILHSGSIVLNTNKQSFNDVGSTLQGAGDLLGVICIPIVNYCPFGDTANKMKSAGNNLVATSGQMSQMETSADQMSQEAYTLSNNMVSMSQQIKDLGNQLRITSNDLRVMNFVDFSLIPVLVYIGILHTMFLVIGVALNRINDYNINC